ncbi:YwaF family protein [Olleya aquimaris]|uniref:Putative integral membrane protein (TIGR02206 family) n=1 Tax=Olleya aquimaris TaxID=639310 RepID=A0A327R4P0_9FLAO|nr:TIGR02206 family membrane protein [Olleya aquimaris]RAJ11779.1 putative integral membrane protein (TIGR02206 family) [Olleya aquimaris]
MQLLARVQFGSLEHLLPIILAIVFCIVMFSYVKSKSEKTKSLVFKYLGIFVSGFILVFHVYQICLGDYNFKTDLPLFLCSFIALFIWVFTLTQKYSLFEILLFWIIAGTSQGVITPDIAEGFPSFDYFRYWVVHLGLLTIIAYAIAILKMRPTIKSVFKSFFMLQIYVVCMLVVNYSLGTNYSYLNSKPISGSVLDYLGDWPYYIIIAQLILLPLFLLIYFPFYLAKKKSLNTIETL